MFRGGTVETPIWNGDAEVAVEAGDRVETGGFGQTGQLAEVVMSLILLDVEADDHADFLNTK